MPNYVPYNFLGLPDELSSYDNSKVAILPVPYDLTLSYGGGARNGPQAIIDASRQVETYDDDYKTDPSEAGICTMPELEQVTSSPDAMQEVIYRACLDLLNDGKFVMTLGGEHSITAALVKAHKEKCSDISVLHIDAHTDLRDSYQGSKFSHACVMARVAEMTSFLSVGVRSFSGNDNERKFESSLLRPRDFRKFPEKFEKGIANLSENVYITFDLDGLDPSVMPSVGTPEPGGLTWDEVLRIIEILSSRKNIVGADVVELSPRTGFDYADFTAARLAYKIIAASIKGK